MEAPRVSQGSPMRARVLPALLASLVAQRSASGTTPTPVMRRVGGISMVSPAAVVNWLLSESFPETKGVR